VSKKIHSRMNGTGQGWGKDWGGGIDKGCKEGEVVRRKPTNREPPTASASGPESTKAMKGPDDKREKPKARKEGGVS